MRFDEKLKHCSNEEIWSEYCGFLDLSLEEYMEIQNRLLTEQLTLLNGCELGRRIFGKARPQTVEEFRRMAPLTTYDDYADILLRKVDSMLPGTPVVWLQTTWEGGDRPVKLAPYTESMLAVYKRNILAAMLLSTSDARGHFMVRQNARVLYSLAPMPYATGLFPDLIESEMKLHFLPPLKEARKMSFSKQSKKGYELSLRGGMDQFFGMSSIIYRISKNLEDFASGGGHHLKSLFHMSPKMLYRLLRASYKAKLEGTGIRPGDLFRLDGFVCVGTDSALYKEELEELWGRRPLELAGGTEPSCMGTETWNKNGLVFFPDACFYEFIPEQEMLHNLDDPTYTPNTYLMDELSANEKYELVITVLKGGAFVRYRVGDVYRCLRLRNQADGIALPQFEYVDRIPTVIDIAGFTRITAREINRVIELSRLAVQDWFALKEYDESNHSYLHLYVEMAPDAVQSGAVGKEILKEHLSVYFRYYDGDYKDLKKLLGVEPLIVTVLKTGSIARYREATGTPIRQMNPTRQAVLDLVRMQSEEPKRGCAHVF